MAKKGSGKRHHSGHGALDSALAELRTSISSGDVLHAEMQVSFLLSLPLLSDGTEEEYGLLADALIDSAEAWGDVPEGAAFLRLLTALGPRPVKRRASEALAYYTDAGIYPPEWVSGIGKPSPGLAYGGRDVFGDREVILVTFSYQDAEHALFVILDLAELPMVMSVDMTMDVARLLKFFEGGGELVERLEPVTLSEARRRIEEPLARAGENPYAELPEDTLLLVPLARSRVRRLPAAEPAAVTYTAADRAAAVGEFLARPEAADAGDPDVARFWAQALTGYSGRVPDEPPGQVGKHKLDAALLGYVARTFTLSAAQLSGIEPAVTAWVRWAASRQGLDEAAAATLMTHLATALGDFQATYDDPRSVAARGYVRDIATPDVDAAWLAGCRARRELAVPLPDNREPHCEVIDAADPDGRAVIVASEFASCKPDGMPKGDFLSAAMRVANELWQDEPTATWQRGKTLLAEGHDRHDVIHLLAEPRYGVKTPAAG
jgi:hypothetical protein